MWSERGERASFLLSQEGAWDTEGISGANYCGQGFGDIQTGGTHSFVCSHRVLFLGLCRLEVRVFRGVEKVSMVILGIGRANSLDCHHCWESAWD